jgi:hypothetical protein
MEKKNDHFEKERIWHPIRRRFLKIMAWIENAHKGKSFCQS